MAAGLVRPGYRSGPGKRSETGVGDHRQLTVSSAYPCDLPLQTRGHPPSPSLDSQLLRFEDGLTLLRW